MKVKLTDWNIQDYLKTPEERMAYIEAAAEEGTPDAIPDAFADVFRALGMNSEAAACEGLANYIRAMPTTTSRTARHKTTTARTARHRTTKRELAKA